MQAWNRSQPSLPYSDVRLFKRDYDRAARVIQPDWFGMTIETLRGNIKGIEKAIEGWKRDIVGRSNDE